MTEKDKPLAPMQEFFVKFPYKPAAYAGGGLFVFGNLRPY